MLSLYSLRVQQTMWYNVLCRIIFEARSVYYVNTQTIKARSVYNVFLRPDMYYLVYLRPDRFICEHTHLQVSLIPPWEDQCEWHGMPIG